MGNNIFDDPSAYNRFRVMNGFSIIQCEVSPSVYISELKLKKAYRRICDEEIENLAGKEMNRVAIKRYRERLEKKLGTLHKWQLFRALSIYIDDEDIEGSAAYVLQCKRSDIDPKFKTKQPKK